MLVGHSVSSLSPSAGERLPLEDSIREIASWARDTSHRIASLLIGGGVRGAIALPLDTLAVSTDGLQLDPGEVTTCIDEPRPW